MARPCKIDTVNFFRRLKDDERAILLAAGAGDLSQGFRDMLAIYAALHNAGFRPGDNVSEWILIANENDSQLDL
jgi:hypothetical protein